jgi:exodeoxyribonuclease V beta subunit
VSTIKILTSPGDIDLSRHGVVEAHAGTGKTHTIVEMVLRILQTPVAHDTKDPRCAHIRDILLVTFTEKAAGELKKRIREGLERRIDTLRNNGAPSAAILTSHLEDCLNNLHEPFIGTIHGICLRLLQTWPFETGVHFATEIVDDSEGLAHALRESMRTDWQDDATQIPWALAHLQERGMRLEEKQISFVCELAGLLQDKNNTVLDRVTCGDLSLAQVRRLIEHSDVPDQCFAERDFYALVAKGISTAKHIVDDPRGCINDAIGGELLRRVSVWEHQVENRTVDPAAFATLNKFGAGKLMNTASTRKHPLFADLLEFHETVQSHIFLKILRGETLALTLACEAALLLRDRWERTKREKGLISFQDMLRLMHSAVTQNPGFCAKLRRRLRYGIIDEFQDTSILQWAIFSRIFLESPDPLGPRLFIVGDPKQSIYSFQGADVQSYLEAKSAIVNKGGRMYGLINNYRSLPETINGYNAILQKDTQGSDWFAFDNAGPAHKTISYPSFVDGGALAKAPDERRDRPRHTLCDKPVQIMILEGNALQRRREMATMASMVIRSIRGKTISIPQGTGWVDTTLDYKDFAVVVETHGLAQYFLNQFQDDGIPAVKYKLEGVFQSPMARDIHALFRAIIHPVGDPAHRCAALLTRFFNRHPAAVDLEKDLEPCTNPFGQCKSGAACIFHAMEEWTFLASRHLWSQLFKSILIRTSIRERLIRCTDGKRHLADLQQVSDYCIEKLYRDNYSIIELVEHLGRLLNGEELAGEDKNLFTLASDKSSVRVLTMHAAKGLEFPVVFVATASSKEPRNAPSALTWIDADHKRHVVPYFANDETRLSPAGKQTPRDTMLVQAHRERRRLLYVALTRAQAMVFVPAHVENVKRDGFGGWQSDCTLPAKTADKDLTPRLLQLLDTRVLTPFDRSRWNARPLEESAKCVDHLDDTWTMPRSAEQACLDIQTRVRNLDLPGRIRRQTSYTELSREADSDRASDRSEEVNNIPAAKNGGTTVLPGGAKTGDALHLAIEELAGSAHTRSLLSDRPSVIAVVKKYLDRNGVLRDISSAGVQSRAVNAAVDFVCGALTTALPLPGDAFVKIVDLARTERIPEMEFFLGVHPHWIHGFMDLVLRLENTKAIHPWRYFVLDWKSDQLDTFDEQGIASRIRERHYDLQAKLYCHALDTHLQGLLGDSYSPLENLGGAAYVFLRSFDSQLPKGQCHVWTRPSRPEEDSKFTKEQIDKLIAKRVGHV